MKFLILFSILAAVVLVNTPDSFSEGLELFTYSKVYSPEQIFQVYGTGLPEETLHVRLLAPDESIAKFDQITTEPDGSFNYNLLIF